MKSHIETERTHQITQFLRAIARLLMTAGALSTVSFSRALGAERNSLSTPPSLSASFRNQLGTVAVAPISRSSEFTFHQSDGKAGYASEGAAEGALEVLNSNPDPLAAPALLAMAPLGALAGAITESRKTVSAADLAEAERDLIATASALIDQKKFQEVFLRVGREKLPYSLAAPPGIETQVNDGQDYSWLARNGVDTALVISVQSVRLHRTSSRDTSYALFVGARARLVRTRDGAVLYDEPIQYRSGTSLFMDWTANRAEPFRRQVETAYEKISDKIVEQVFLNRYPETKPARNYFALRPRNGRGVPRHERRTSNGIIEVVAPALTPKLVANLGTVGIISTSTIPKISLQRPLTKGQAVQMAVDDSETFVDNVAATAGTAGELLSYGPAVPFSLAKQIIGGVQGVTKSSLHKSDTVLVKVLQNAHPQEGLRRAVAEQARALTSHPIIVVKKPFPAGQEEEFSQMATVMAGTLAWIPEGQTHEYYLKSQGVDTVLEIQLLYPALNGEAIINPPIAFSLEVRTSLTRVQEPEPFYSFSLKYRGAECKFSEWAGNDAQPLRDELERCYQTIAVKIVEQLAVPAWPSETPVELAKGRGE